MKTIVLQEPGRFTMDQRSAPEAPGAGEALVRVHRVGVCGTDLHAYRGRQPFFDYPRVLGHELGVEVQAVGDGVTNVSAGDRCAVEPYMNCGTCIACRRGRPNCCAELKVLGVHVDGGLRSHLVLPANKLHRSGKLSFEQLALVETLGIGAHAVQRSELEEDEPTLVIGAGPIGLGAIQFAQAAGARVGVMDISDARLDFCRAQLGVERTIKAQDGDMTEALRARFDGDLPTAVLDATGNLGSMQRAFDLVAPSGRLTFVGLVRENYTFYDPELHRRELTLLASRNSTPDDFGRIIALMESGAIDTSAWVTHRSGFDGLIDAFDGWLEPGAGVIKAVVEM